MKKKLYLVDEIRYFWVKKQLVGGFQICKITRFYYLSCYVIYIDLVIKGGHITTFATISFFIQKPSKMFKKKLE